MRGFRKITMTVLATLASTLVHGVEIETQLVQTGRDTVVLSARLDGEQDNGAMWFVYFTYPGRALPEVMVYQHAGAWHFVELDAHRRLYIQPEAYPVVLRDAATAIARTPDFADVAMWLVLAEGHVPAGVYRRLYDQVRTAWLADPSRPLYALDALVARAHRRLLPPQPREETERDRVRDLRERIALGIQMAEEAVQHSLRTASAPAVLPFFASL